ncbi:MAG: thioredoxin family protein [Proteobacteria bacterium]|nr:thioredoxin family protein [Pseudomonadota bacterium]MBU4576795.1 thioredoxin family protein [Pseudomonadota bacterium]
MDIEINKDNYQEIVVDAGIPTVVDFWGPRCERCLQLMPGMERIAQEKGDQLRLVKIDASQNRRLCMNLRLLSLPAFIFYRDGKEVQRLSGEQLTEDDLQKAVDQLLAGK